MDSLESIIASQKQVEEILHKLTVNEREIIYLLAIKGYTTQACAEFLEIPKETLLSKIHRLRKRFEKGYAELSKVGPS